MLSTLFLAFACFTCVTQANLHRLRGSEPWLERRQASQAYPAHTIDMPVRLAKSTCEGFPRLIYRRLIISLVALDINHIRKQHSSSDTSSMHRTTSPVDPSTCTLVERRAERAGFPTFELEVSCFHAIRTEPPKNGSHSHPDLDGSYQRPWSHSRKPILWEKLSIQYKHNGPTSISYNRAKLVCVTGVLLVVY